MGGEEGKTGGSSGDEDYDIMAGEEGNNGGEDYDDDEDYDSVPDDNGDNSRDKDYVPKLFESSYDDDFDHLNDDDINEEDERIENMDSKSRIPTAVGGTSLWGDLFHQIISLCQPPKPVTPEASIRLCARVTVTVFAVRG
jgi:hypothetical protein